MTDTEDLARLAKQVMKDPALLRQFSDRVYALMHEEVLNQQDRQGSYQRRF
ncbi:hypothetical protein [Leptolyngbya sp. CCY15150]|uniref:hypothetical protein n=1 Tax=Leptolyngbya sp. CCY15150 TaxID=2767772 RepID=UPI00194E447B|nr:hypothetical protein [Leptolyngbya sp. CCY15150]